MIKVIRVYEPSIIDKLKENFVEDGSYTRDIAGDEFKLLLEKYPDRICVLVSYDEDKITGYLIGFLAFDRNYVVLDQVYNSMDSIDAFATANTAMTMFKEWCKSIGANEIRLETERKSVAEKCMRFLGFTEKGVSLRLEL
jgi:hypothetical protein